MADTVGRQYAIDLVKLDGCKEIFSRPVEDWQVSEDEEDEEDEDEGYEDDEYDEDGDAEMEEPKKQLFTPSQRKKKQLKAEEASNADTASTAPSTAPPEEEEESVATTVDDGLPHPRVSIFPIHHPFPARGRPS